MKNAHDNGIGTPDRPAWSYEIELQEWDNSLTVNISGEIFIGIHSTLYAEDNGEQLQHIFLFMKIDRATRSLRGIAVRPIGGHIPLHVLGRWIASGTSIDLKLKFLRSDGSSWTKS
jgi:hypothetical protein